LQDFLKWAAHVCGNEDRYFPTNPNIEDGEDFNPTDAATAENAVQDVVLPAEPQPNADPMHHIQEAGNPLEELNGPGAENQDPNPAAAELLAQESDDSDEDTNVLKCVTCMTNARTHMCYPCCHLILCEVCVGHHQRIHEERRLDPRVNVHWEMSFEPPCPQCRAPVREFCKVINPA
jgi:hypothetical protein